ncbi:hypothetical protein AB0305_05980 [Arthrobacter sp. NPDC080086]
MEDSEVQRPVKSAKIAAKAQFYQSHQGLAAAASNHAPIINITPFVSP